MSYQIKQEPPPGKSVFWVGEETGALYVKTGFDAMVCIDAGQSNQRVGHSYSPRDGRYRMVNCGAELTIQVGK